MAAPGAGVFGLGPEVSIVSKLDIGRPGPANAGGLDVGEGGSYSVASDGTTIKAYTYDASASSGSRFAALDIEAANTLKADIGDRIYVACPDVFWAVRFAVAVAGSANGWQCRYWNGSALQDIAWMGITKSNAVRLGSTFMQAIETEYATWDRDITLDWATADNQLDTIPNTGTALYWVCFQAVATHTTAPRVDEIKIRGSDVDIISGNPPHMVFWGRARFQRSENVDAETLRRQGANTPTLTDLDIAAGIETVVQAFGQNDRLPLAWEIPEECDTSCAVRFAIKYSSSATSTITLAIAVKIVKSGGAINSGEAVTDTITKTVTPTGAAVMDIDVELTEPLSGNGNRIDLTNFDPGDEIFFDIKRTDAEAGTFLLLSIHLTYALWEHGAVT